MGELTEALTHHDLVGFDTSIFIYQVEDSPRYATIAEEALSALSDGAFKGVTSVLTLMEVAVRPLQLGREDAANDYELLLSTFPNLLVVDLSTELALAARRSFGPRIGSGRLIPSRLPPVCNTARRPC